VTGVQTCALPIFSPFDSHIPFLYHYYTFVLCVPARNLSTKPLPMKSNAHSATNTMMSRELDGTAELVSWHTTQNFNKGNLREQPRKPRHPKVSS